MLVLLLYGIPVFSQQMTTVRIGLAIPHSGTKEVSDAAMRDALIKALNHEADKKKKIALQAVPLEQPPGSKAIAEANQKSCSFVLYVVVRSIATSDHPVPSGTGGVQNHQVETATVEYQIRRASDGAAYAIGTAQSQGLGSDRDAILQAAERVSGQVLAEFEKGDHSALAENGESEKNASGLRQDMSVEASFCDWLPTSIPHAEALRGVCEYAATLPQKMPNFVCQQVTSRYEGEHHIPDDLITGTVRYEDGEESYSGLMRNGKPIPESMWNAGGLWTTGQFEGSLRAIFHSANHAVFEFSREDHIGERRVWVFTYEIARQNEPVWVLRAQDQVASPPYRGEVWVDQKTGELRRFTTAAQQIPRSFPMEKAESATDYDDIPFGDGTAFVLPSQSNIATTYAGREPTRNEVQFRNCHKFRATAHLVANLAGGPEGPGSSAANSSESLRAELEDDKTIYTILREQAIRDDAALLEAEQRSDLNIATVRALWKLAALEREREKKESAEAPNSKNSSAAPGPPISTLKVSVNLVPVLVVLRKANGEAVGNLPKESFQLFDNGKPQTITRFAVESPGGPRSTLNEPSSAAGAQGGTDAPETAAPKSVAYVFDDLHTASADLARARDAAAEELAKLTAGDLAGVFATSGEGGGADFTSDRGKLQSALRGLKSHAGQDSGECPPMTYYEADQIVNQSNTAALTLAMADTTECAHTTRPDEARRLAESAAFDVLGRGQMDSRRALETLNTVLSRVASMPGDRSIVLVSPGFLATAAELREKGMSLIALAVQDGVVVNVLDANGLTTMGVSANRSHSTDEVEQSQLDNNEAMERSEVLADLAYGTGGIFFHNNNDLKEGFRRTSEPPEFVYVLGFAPQKLDGKFHKLKVKVANPKLTVQARQGYYAHE
jgi:VWFA-related protein